MTDPDPPAPRQPPQQGAALILRRSDGRVLVGARTHLARSWPGTLAFPGGAVDDDDVDLPLFSGTTGTDGQRRGAALREALEEAGVVRLCRPAHDAGADLTLRGPSGPSAPSAPMRVVDDVRRGRPLGAALRDHGLVLDDRGLVDLGTWLTAEGTFLVTRYLLDVGDAVDGGADGGVDRGASGLLRVAALQEELVDVEFQSPGALIDGWRAGSVFLLPPIRLVLTRLAAHEQEGDVDVVARALALPPSEPERRRRDLIDGVVVIDTRTPTLPPAVSTNCVVLGTGDVLLVDPATPYADEQARFDDVLDVILEGRRVAGIFLTHHHVDHVGDAERLRRKHGCPVLAHKETAARVAEQGIGGLHIVDDGQVFLLGRRRFRAVFTPGHAPGHLCLFDDDARLLIAGDMIAGVGSILIDPPEGHMATYLGSLDRLIALQPRSLIPAHGPLLVDATSRLAQQKQHRQKRAAMVKDAIVAGARDATDVVAAVYGSDTPPAMFAFAARSVAAIVEQLQEDGAVVVDAGGWRALLG